MDRLQSRRQGVRLFVILLVIDVVLGGAALAVGLSLGSAGNTTTTNPATSSSNTPSSPTDAPTTGEPDPEPGPTEESEAPPASSEELSELETALEQVGYACYESVREPVVVHSCYLEPGTRSLDEQVVRIQVGPDGKLAAVDVDISYFEDGKAALRLFEKTVPALTGTVLQANEASKVLAGRTVDQVEGPGTHNKQTLRWGRSTLFVSADKRSYHLELEVEGGKSTPIPHGNTPVTIQELKDRYEGKDFTCEIDTELESMKCQRRETGAVYTILAFDPCIKASGDAREQLCQNATAYSVSASVGFGQNLPDEQYARFVTFLIESTDFAVGGMSSETQSWLTASMNDPNAKVHRADFQQVHLSVEPGAGVYEEFPNVFQVEVTGHNLTQ